MKMRIRRMIFSGKNDFSAFFGNEWRIRKRTRRRRLIEQYCKRAVLRFRIRSRDLEGQLERSSSKYRARCRSKPSSF